MNSIRPGAILIEQSTELPAPMRLEVNSAQCGWARLTGHLNGYQVDKQLTSAGWTFFYTAGAIRTTAWGFERSKMLESALRRLITIVKRHKCNCLEIDEVSTHTFLGIPYVSLSAHSRQIQKNLVFSER